MPWYIQAQSELLITTFNQVFIQCENFVFKHLNVSVILQQVYSKYNHCQFNQGQSGFGEFSLKHAIKLLKYFELCIMLVPICKTRLFNFQYTCFDVSPSFLVFGATSGGLYLFRREPCTFLQLLPNKVHIFTCSSNF